MRASIIFPGLYHVTGGGLSLIVRANNPFRALAIGIDALIQLRGE